MAWIAVLAPIVRLITANSISGVRSLAYLVILIVDVSIFL
jgi:hypothetical protein